MPVFTIQTPSGKKIRIDAPDQETAIRGAQEYEAGQAKPVEMSDPAPQGSPQFNANMGELSAMTQNPAAGQYEQLPGWQKPLVAGNDILTMLANGATFGFGDKAAAAVRAPFTDKTYDQELEEQRRKTRGSRNRSGWAGTVAELTGGIGTGLKIANAGLTATRFAPAASAGLPRLGALMGGSAVDGAAYGAASALGNDTSVGAGMATGAVIGGLTPAAFALVRNAFAPLFSRLAPERATNDAIETMVSRSGKSPQQIVDDLNAAAREGQDVFTVADSLGNPGQRMLSTIARTPNEGRASVVEALERRQAGQGGRLANFVSRALDSSDTAAQRTAGLQGDRSTLANLNYPAARAGASPVDVSGALREIDDVLMPGVNRLANPGSNIADDSLEGIVRRVRGLLSDGRSNLTNFDSVMRAKQDIADMIGAAQRQGRNNQVRILSQINANLDTALERASPGYRQANDAFRDQSRTMDAVEAGKAATSGRSRASDNIAGFNRMRPGEQSAFRAGYADPVVGKIEASAPGVNKARPLTSDKMSAELNRFAVPQRRARLGRQIGREQTMFETRNQALGGSRTADNLADQAEMNVFDPTILGNLLSGNLLGAGAAASRQSIANLQGLSPGVRTRLAEFLLTRHSGTAMQRIARAIAQGQRVTARDIATIRLLVGSSVLGVTNSQRLGQ